MWSISLHYSNFYFVLHWPLAVTCCHYAIRTRYSSSSSVDTLSVSNLLFCICCLYYPRVYSYIWLKQNQYIQCAHSAKSRLHVSSLSSLARFERFCARGPHQVSSGKQHKMAAESCFWTRKNLTQQLLHRSFTYCQTHFSKVRTCSFTYFMLSFGHFLW